MDKVPHGPMEKFSFIFPEEIRDIIKKKNDDLKKSKTREDGTTVKEDHYANFFRPRHSDNIITNFIYEAYSKLGWKKFISLTQKHIAERLSSVDLSSNQELIEYLSIVGNETIVPYEISHNSNDEFLHLIEKGKNGDNEAVIMVISNFFVSSVLGLRSMNYSRGFGERGKNLPYKTYLLSRTGMECIWKPDLISPPYERLFDSRKLFKNTNYEGAIKTVEEWLKEYETVASNEARALAYQILGTSLYNLSSSDDEKGKDGQLKGIEYLKKCIRTGEADLSVYYSLYDKLKESSSEDALGYLKTAFAQNYAKAVIEVASLYLDGTCVFDDVTAETLLKKINYIIEHERRNDVDDVGKCLYLHGKFYKKHGNETKANEYFEAASKRGNERARQEITRKNVTKGTLFRRLLIIKRTLLLCKFLYRQQLHGSFYISE